MPPRRSSGSPPAPAPAPASARIRTTETEWIGGRFRFPARVGTGPDASEPDLVLWAEDRGNIVGFSLVSAGDPPFPVARALEEAMERPKTRPPRRPDRVRLADPQDAEEVRARFGDRLTVVTGPTPELDALRESLLEFLHREAPEPSHFEAGAGAEDIAHLFSAALELFRAAPRVGRPRAGARPRICQGLRDRFPPTGQAAGALGTGARRLAATGEPARLRRPAPPGPRRP